MRTLTKPADRAKGLLACGRKPVWLELQRQGLAQVRASLFRPLSAAEARATLQGRQLGVAALRLLPKRTGARLSCLVFTIYTMAADRTIMGAAEIM
jgi:hypothetical protein